MIAELRAGEHESDSSSMKVTLAEPRGMKVTVDIGLSLFTLFTVIIIVILALDINFVHTVPRRDISLFQRLPCLGSCFSLVVSVQRKSRKTKLKTGHEIIYHSPVVLAVVEMH